MGIKDGKTIYEAATSAPGKKLIFAPTGVTDGSLLRGVRLSGGVRTQSLIMTLDEHDMRSSDSVHVENEDVKIRFYQSFRGLAARPQLNADRSPNH